MPEVGTHGLRHSFASLAYHLGMSELETMELGDVTKKKMLERIAGKLGITTGYTFTMGEGDGFSKTILTKESRNAKTILQIVSLYDEEDAYGAPDQYIAIEISTRTDTKQAVDIYEKVKKIYEEMDIESQVSIEIDASRRGDYVSLQGKGIFEDIFREVKAKKVDDIMENGICTVYGYTKAEDNYLVLDDKKVNIQIVLSYDEDKDITYIKIGMPIVNSSY